MLKYSEFHTKDTKPAVTAVIETVKLQVAKVFLVSSITNSTFTKETGTMKLQ
jgi:hypothetical protein